MANALAGESSPYLRQHASNPVDWLPWGEQAIERARELDRPLLVSIGYSSCHWCHVMERESFEDPRTAALMNESFVCVKVDREERPDVDAIYMEAVQGMTGRGGWPLNVFLTPEQVPFYGGTYFPPEPRGGMPSFAQVLQAVAEAWEQQGDEIRASGERLRERLAGGALLSPSREPLQAGALTEAVRGLEGAFDARNGGFGGAPKFPQAPVLELLLARAADHAAGGQRAGEMALATLRAMAQGGIHDVVGGGFHRYAVDERWTVPHFEKMLYDNALLARAYLHGFQVCGEARLLEVCLDTLGWALREMRGPEGGFYSALDADSEGVEGSFYVWSLPQLREALGEADGAAAAEWLGVSERGNFADPHHPQPGLNVLTDRGPRPDRSTRERILAGLARAREQRPRPELDTKRLTAWNALMIGALAEAGAHLAAGAKGGEELIDAARRCASFVLGSLRDERGRLLRTFGDGAAKLPAYLEDHAFLLEALLALYEATFEERWFEEARSLADQLIALFADPANGGFYSTAVDHEQLLVRRKELEDSPIPAGASSAAVGLLRLAALTGEHDYERHAVSVLRLLHEIAPRHPTAFGHLLLALHVHLAPMREVAIVGAPEQADPLLRIVRARYRPAVALAAAHDEQAEPAVPLLAGRGPLDGRAAAYVCERQSCQAPVTEPARLAAQLDPAPPAA